MRLRYTGLIEQGIPDVLPMHYPGEVLEVSDELAAVLLTRDYEQVPANTRLGRNSAFERQAGDAYVAAAMGGEA